MTKVREHFMSLLEDDIDLEVVLRHNSKVKAEGVETVLFQKESSLPLKVTNVLYVLGLKKILISISSLEDRGFEVLFQKRQVLIYPRGSSVEFSCLIGSRSGRLYILMSQPLQVMVL